MYEDSAIERINFAVSSCIRCDLWKRRKKTVPGAGCEKAKVMLIGEAPGRQEDTVGLPFVGAAGKILDEQLNRIGLSRDEVYITNIVKCRPPSNREPLAEEVSTCTQLYLNHQIRAIKPQVLVLLGRHSSTYILSKAGVEFKGITQAHGKVYRVKPFNIQMVAIPMFHPAAILYTAKYRKFLIEDFNVLKYELKL